MPEFGKVAVVGPDRIGSELCCCQNEWVFSIEKRSEFVHSLVSKCCRCWMAYFTHNGNGFWVMNIPKQMITGEWPWVRGDSIVMNECCGMYFAEWDFIMSSYEMNKITVMVQCHHPLFCQHRSWCLDGYIVSAIFIKTKIQQWSLAKKYLN